MTTNNSNNSNSINHTSKYSSYDTADHRAKCKEYDQLMITIQDMINDFRDLPNQWREQYARQGFIDS